MITSLLLGLVLVLPSAWEPYRATIEADVAEATEEFYAQCVKWQLEQRCDRAVERARLFLLDTDRFECGLRDGRKCRGQYFSIRRIYIAYDNLDADAIIIHELCHFFGREVGHHGDEGFEECQSIK
jgi:hypothetical protein